MRYSFLPRLIQRLRPGTLAEIGTWKGDRAIDCLKALRATGSSTPFHYVGFDVFEDGDGELDRKEFNVKQHHSLATVAERLSSFGDRNFTFELVKGNTRDRDKPIEADIAFIDGGHSVDTIAHDLYLCRGCPVIVLDDFYSPDNSGKCPDRTKFGCNSVIEGMNYAVLPERDAVSGGGLVHMAVIPGFLAKHV